MWQSTDPQSLDNASTTFTGEHNHKFYQYSIKVQGHLAAFKKRIVAG